MLRLLSALALVASAPASAQEHVYDFYEKGIRNAEITIGEVYSGRIRDRRTNAWSTHVDGDIALAGSLRNLPRALAELNRIDWTTAAAIAWPDAETIYVRHRELVAAGVTAWYWAERDATLPMDLVIGTDGTMLAATDPSRDAVFVRRGYEAFTNVERWAQPHVEKGRFGYRDLGKAMVPMKDGVKLATRIYLPDDGTRGPYPTIFIRTPYGIGRLIESYWHYPARGYALVVQAVRGSSYMDPDNLSEGVWEPVINEPKDGRDALDWVASQSWCDGNIGMLGGSYVGYTQWAASMAKHPALKTLVPEVSMGTVFSDQPYMGGGFVSGMAYYDFFMLNLELLPDLTWSEVLDHRPLIDIDTFATGTDLPQWNVFFEHQTNDAYWGSQNWYDGDHPRSFATLQISGWFDDDFLGTRRNWELMKRYGTMPQRLIVGPWKHGYNRDRMLNGTSFGSEAVRDDIWLIKQMWFDRFLKGIENGVDDTKVDYFVLGANEWRSASQWPPPESRVQTWHLHSAGSAESLSTDGRLDRKPPEGTEPSDVFEYDPKDPPHNWMSFEQMLRWEDVQTFPYDFRDIERRHDVVVYTSAPLTEDLTIAGDLMVVLYASTNVRDTDWWVQVSDVDETGASTRLTLGSLRARFRNLEDKEFHVFGSNFEKEELLSGNFDDVVRYDIAIHAVAATIRQGHRLRIAVMNALDNYTFPNSNTGENEGHVTRTVVGKMAIHHSSMYPSHILLPVLP